MSYTACGFCMHPLHGGPGSACTNPGCFKFERRSARPGKANRIDRIGAEDAGRAKARAKRKAARAARRSNRKAG